MKTRLWSFEANEKRNEGCRHCGRLVRVELDHHSGRANDRPRTPGSKTVYVEPEDVVPLCGPFPEGCHGARHRHEFALWPLMHEDEKERAIEIYGTESLARRHLGQPEETPPTPELEREAPKMSSETAVGRYHPDEATNKEIALGALEAELHDIAAGYEASEWECECGARHRRGPQPNGGHRCLACGFIGVGGRLIPEQAEGIGSVEGSPKQGKTYTTEQARMRLREVLATAEWPEDGTAEEYFIREVFPDESEDSDADH